MLRKDEDFFAFCEIYAGQVGKGVAVDDFNRALSDMLMRNNDALRFKHKTFAEGCKMCEEVARVSLKVLSEYAKGGCKKSFFLKRILCIILFLLRRRKYDKAFFRGKLRDDFREVRDDLFMFYQNDGKLKELYNVVSDYVDARGTLDGIIAISDEINV